MIYTAIVCLLLVKGIASTNISKNLQMTFDKNMIVLQCMVDKPRNGVFFYHPRGKNVAQCHFVPEPSCDILDDYGQVDYISNTNTTVFKVNVSETDVNGNWSCANGRGKKDPRFSVLVEIAKSKTLDMSEQKEYINNMEIEFPSLASFFVLLFITSFILGCRRRYVQRRKADNTGHRGHDEQIELAKNDSSPATHGIIQDPCNNSIEDHEQGHRGHDEQIELAKNDSSPATNGIIQDPCDNSIEDHEQEEPNQGLKTQIRKKASSCVAVEYVGIGLGSLVCGFLFVIIMTGVLVWQCHVKDINKERWYYIFFPVEVVFLGVCIFTIWNSCRDDNIS